MNAKHLRLLLFNPNDVIVDGYFVTDRHILWNFGTNTLKAFPGLPPGPGRWRLYSNKPAAPLEWPDPRPTPGYLARLWESFAAPAKECVPVEWSPWTVTTPLAELPFREIPIRIGTTSTHTIAINAAVPAIVERVDAEIAFPAYPYQPRFAAIIRDGQLIGAARTQTTLHIHGRRVELDTDPVVQAAIAQLERAEARR